MVLHRSQRVARAELKELVDHGSEEQCGEQCTQQQRHSEKETLNGAQDTFPSDFHTTKLAAQLLFGRRYSPTNEPSGALMKSSATGDSERQPASSIAAMTRTLPPARSS